MHIILNLDPKEGEKVSFSQEILKSWFCQVVVL